jgi:hypothetical protein
MSELNQITLITPVCVIDSDGRTRENTFWKDNSESDRSLFFGLVERDHALHLASVIQHADFAAPEFCTRSGVADCLLFCRVARPVRLDTPTS